jgi:hypothetical protein
MPVDVTPPAWIPSISEDGTDVTFPIASLPELTAAEADAATGDFRKLMFAIMENNWVKWNALASADRPTKMTLAKSISTDPVTGIATQTFTVVFKTSVTSQDVTAE